MVSRAKPTFQEWVFPEEGLRDALDCLVLPLPKAPYLQLKYLK
jgi:hypothetical protein